ncbi:MAG: AAA family ATPase [Candidatus Bathyarchaeia archaeon]
MILKTLELQNIRSYDKLKVDFPEGIILFEGATGSGKSTILMAIEFALFGLGSIKGSSLLRLGAQQGNVSLTFDVDGKEYTVNRTLEKKGKSVHQGSGYVVEPKGKLSLEPSEIKQRILDILHFNEPEDPKAQSWIYRYAVFTPQEEMKTILTYKPDIRLQTLRKAFKLEEYKIAIENSSKLNNEIKTKIVELKATSKELELKQENQKDKGKEKEQIEKDLTELETKESKHQEQLTLLKTELEKLLKDSEQLVETQTLKSQLEKQVCEKTESREEEKQNIKKSKATMDEIENRIKQYSKKRKPTSLTIGQLEKEISKLETEESELIRTKNQIETKLTDYEKLEKEKICPTCDRPTKSKDFKEIIKKKKNELQQAKKTAENVSKKLKDSRDLLRKVEAYQADQRQLKEIRRQKKQNLENLKKVKARFEAFSQEIDEFNSQLERLEKLIVSLSQVAENMNKLKGGIREKDEEIGKTKEKIATKKQRKLDLSEDIIKLSKEIENMIKARNNSDILHEYNMWLSDYFEKTIELIEKQVMMAINQDFNREFEKWFNLLVEDPTKEATIDEDFTPIIRQDGYDQNVEFLSGGEKTSVALAYRLALNSIVKQVSVGMKSNLLILDEPTDGFSKEQLYKVREILDELNCPQIVLVSHESELESFANHIIRVEKTAGISKVNRAS